jgi:hypothetical protein
MKITCRDLWQSERKLIIIIHLCAMMKISFKILQSDMIKYYLEICDMMKIVFAYMWHDESIIYIYRYLTWWKYYIIDIWHDDSINYRYIYVTWWKSNW